MSIHRPSRSVPLACLAIELWLAAGCACVRVTPETIRASRAPPELKAQTEATWREAVEILNDFLASPYNLSLPNGRYHLDDKAGLSFVTEKGAMPVAVTCSWLGDLIYLLGGQAASLSRGFVVARTHGVSGDRSVDNTLFQLMDGERKPAHKVASTTIHETSHLVHGRGFWKNVGYALELLFLFRTNKNSAEKRPQATSVELLHYLSSKGIESFESPENVKITFAAYLFSLPVGENHHGPYTGDDARWSAHLRLARGWFAETIPALPGKALRDELRGLERELMEIDSRRGNHPSGGDGHEADRLDAARILERARNAAWKREMLGEAFFGKLEKLEKLEVEEEP